MEIKARESSGALQWLKRRAKEVLAYVSGRTWMIVLVSFSALSLAFYAGEKLDLPRPVVQAANYIFTLDFSRADKYLKGLFASPRRMRIDIKHTNYQKLRFKREEAFGRGIIVTTDDSYVPAQVTVDNKTYRVSMRLKGDYPNHLEGDKWSFRIHVKDGDAIWGMRRLSIQDPKRSGWLKEWVLYEWFKYEDLMALRYDYVDVTLNGRNLGVFAIEESFGKEFVEHNKRTEGPILKFDEKNLIDTSATNLGDSQGQADVYYAADIISFNTSKTMGTEKLKNNFLAGRALLDQLRSRQRSLSEVMDVERAARSFAIADILSGQHAYRWKNSRFYYSPISARFELIAYNMYGRGSGIPKVDQIAYQYWLTGEEMSAGHVQDWLDIFFSEQEFVKAYFGALNRMSAPGYLEGFFKSISDELTERTHILYGDGTVSLTPVKDYLANRDAVYELLHPKIPIKAYLKDFDNQSGRLTLTVANTSFLPVQFEALECNIAGTSYGDIEPAQLGQKTAGTSLQYSDIEVSRIAPEDSVCLRDVGRIDDRQVLNDLRVRYRILGADESRWANIDPNPIDPAWGTFPRPPSGTNSVVAAAPKDMLRINGDSREIVIRPGNWVLTQDLVFPSGFQIVGNAGTTIVLNEGAALISFSPLQLHGSVEAPIVVNSDDGSGQGIVVLGAAGRSALSHVTIRNNRSITRGSWTLTGTVTFYESDVDFANVFWEGNSAEDMANLIRSNYSIRDSSFIGSASDSLDVDFGDGVIERSIFSSCGNDCIDFSGSNSTISSVEVRGAGDKGVSVGEQSRVEVIDSRISDTNIGVASKDNSVVDIDGLAIHDTVTGLASYQKKPEYSGAALRAEDVVLENTEYRYYIQQGSEIVHDSRTIDCLRVPNSECQKNAPISL